MILNLIRRLSLLWRRFTPLEEFLLGVLQQHLPEGPKQINQGRIDLINHVVRYLQWTDIQFYQMRKGKAVVDEGPLFPCRSKQQIVLAEIRFSPAGTAKVWTSRIYAVCGHMFSIVTSPSPKPISFSSPFTLKGVQLVDDPMQELPATLMERRRKRLPPDFEELAGQSIPGWDVFQSSQVYSVALDEGEYLLLAERGGHAAFLGVRMEGKSNDVWLLSHDDRKTRKAGATLKEALAKWR
jgi:hypothetical protein